MCSWEWFSKENRGKATGLILAGFGVSPFIFGILTTLIINPDDVKREMDHVSKDKFFPSDVTSRMPRMYCTCLCIWVFLAIISLFTVKRNP